MKDGGGHCPSKDERLVVCVSRGIKPLSHPRTSQAS